jgi:uncharacterized DUF497 family protein
MRRRPLLPKWNRSRFPILIAEGEERFLIVGVSSLGRVVVVSHAERGDNIRIISARRADAHERRNYGR